jgi:hypothetical protein
MCGIVSLCSALLFTPAANPKTAGPKAPPPPAAVQQAVDAYLKAVAAKDLGAMAQLADVPWLDLDRKVIRDRAALHGALKKAVGQWPRQKGKRKVETVPYQQVRKELKAEAERKLLDGLLGEGGWLTSVEVEGYPLAERLLLLRVKGTKAVVVAGPLKPNQFSPTNRIPEAVENLFGTAREFELLSLDPDRVIGKDGNVAPVKNGFHGWKVLGKTEVKGRAERKWLADALRLGAEDNFGMAAACFIPRHGLRLEGGGRKVDLVICFECLQVQVFIDGKPAAGFLTSAEPQQTFDAVLKAAGVKLPRPAGPSAGGPGPGR